MDSIRLPNHVIVDVKVAKDGLVQSASDVSRLTAITADAKVVYRFSHEAVSRDVLFPKNSMNHCRETGKQVPRTSTSQHTAESSPAGWRLRRPPARHLLCSSEVVGVASTDHVWRVFASTLTAAKSALPMFSPTLPTTQNQEASGERS